MSASNPSPTLDELLRHADWVTKVARELVIDEHRAADVVQETWIAALERPPSDASNPRNWLATVARNVARGIGRSEGRRSRRERAAARGEALPSTAEIAERAALQRDLVDRVLQQDEPYRSVLLLRYFEGLEPHEIATRLGVPSATVRTQLARGLEKMRVKLSRDYGDRESWSIALLGLARMADRNAGVATAGVAGGLVVQTKAVLSIAALAVAVGASLWMWDASDVSQPPPPLAAGDAGDTLSSQAADPATDATGGGERIGLAAIETPGEAVGARPAAAATLHARTVDVLGHPVGGVEIKLVAFQVPFGTPEEHTHQRGIQAAKVREPGRGTTDPLLDRLTALPTLQSDDRGVLEYAEGTDVRSLHVWQRGRTLVGGGWRTSVAGEEELLLVVAPTTTLEGTVVYEDGTPAGNASVQGRTSIVALDEFPWSLRRSFEGADDVGTTTDAHGRFSLVGAPRIPTFSLGAVAKENARSGMYAPFDPSLEPGPLEIVVVRDADRYPVEVVVTGRVVDARGEPAPEVKVRLGHRDTKSAQDGSFRLELGRGLDEAQVLRPWANPQFRYDLVAVRPGFQPAIVEGFGRKLADPRVRENVVLQLGPASLAIEGRVVGERGEPLAGLEVELLDPSFVGMSSLTIEDLARSTDVRGMRARRILTDAGGRFAIDGLLRRPYRVLAIGVESRVVLESEPIEAGRNDVELRVPEGSVHEQVRGRVVSRGGAPVAGIEVGLDLGWQTDWGIVFRKRAQTVVTDRQGRFEVERVPKRLACLSVVGRNVQLTVLDAVDIVAGVDVEIVADVLVRFRVELRPGDAADGFEVRDGADQRMQGILPQPDGGTAMFDRVPIRDRKSGVCQVDDAARSIVLFMGDRELRRLPIDLSVDELRVIVP